MRIIIVITLLIVSLYTYSQKSDTAHKMIEVYGIKAGINYSKFSNDSFNFKGELVFGIFGKYKFSDKIVFKAATLYSRKGSTSSSSYVKYVNSYIDLNLIPQYRIFSDLYFQAGFCYSFILASKRVTYNGEKWNGVSKTRNNDYDSEINLLAGLELKLQKNWRIEFNYFIPCSKNNIQNLQFSLNYSLINIKSNTVSKRTICRNLSKE